MIVQALFEKEDLRIKINIYHFIILIDGSYAFFKSATFSFYLMCTYFKSHTSSKRHVCTGFRRLPGVC